MPGRFVVALPPTYCRAHVESRVPAALSLTLVRGVPLFHMGASLQTSAGTKAQGVALSLTRIPMVVGVGASFERGSFRLQPIFSLALDHLRVLAPELEDSRRRGRLMMGPRIALRSSWGTGRFRPFAMVRGSWFPRDYVVDVAPLGEVFRTPRFWLGLSLGVGMDPSKSE